jgi:hypothetical protein
MNGWWPEMATMRAAQLKAALADINAAKAAAKKSWTRIDAWEDVPNTGKLTGVPCDVCTVDELESFVRFVARELAGSFAGDAKREAKVPALVTALCGWEAPK